MTRPTVKFYFAFNSPFSFLANSRLEHELARFGAEIEATPVYAPRTGPPPGRGSPSLKFQYLIEDAKRFAAACGLPWKPGPFPDTKLACLGYLEAARQGEGLAYRRGVFAARWCEARDIGDAAVLGRIAASTRLDEPELLRAVADGRHEGTLERLATEREVDGAFGVPFFIWNGKRFWGNDRIGWLVREMGGDTTPLLL